MSGSLDNTLSDVAIKLINKFGKDVVYTNTLYNEPTTQQIAEGDFSDTSSTTEYDIVLSPPQPFLVALIDGITVKYGDTNAFLQGQKIDFLPNISDSLLIDGSRYVVVDFSPLYSGNNIAVYELHLRSIGSNTDKEIITITAPTLASTLPATLYL